MRLHTHQFVSKGNAPSYMQIYFLWTQATSYRVFPCNGKAEVGLCHLYVLLKHAFSKPGFQEQHASLSEILKNKDLLIRRIYGVLLKSRESELDIGFLFHFEKKHFKIMLRIPDKVIGNNVLYSKQIPSEQTIVLCALYNFI